VKATALIPARGGSKGLPGKNLRQLCGQTLLARCIATCRAAVSDVLVSTESEEIAREARRCGARVHWRPHSLATDTATTWAVVKDAAMACGDTIVLAQCTAPLMTPGDALRCLERLGSCDMSVCVHECHDLLVDRDGSPVNWSLPPQRRQDMRAQYRLSGSCWAFRRTYAAGEEYGGKLGIVLSQNPIRLDIDTAEDLRLAAAIIEHHQPTRHEVAELLLTG
jgi:CMP-N-acetylneuraminic acid synthetase